MISVPIERCFFYLGLLSELPSNGSPHGVEQSGSGYRRRPVVFGRPEGGYRRNIADVLFDRSEMDWDVVVGFAVYTSFEGGRRLDSFPCASKVFFSHGDQLLVEAGEIEVASVVVGDVVAERRLVELDGDGHVLTMPRVEWASAPESAWSPCSVFTCGIVIGARAMFGRRVYIVLGEHGKVFAADPLDVGYLDEVVGYELAAGIKESAPELISALEPF